MYVCIIIFNFDIIFYLIPLCWLLIVMLTLCSPENIGGILLIGSTSCNMTLLLLDCAENKQALLVKIASVREVVMGAPLRVILKRLASRSVPSNAGMLVPLVHRPNESFFLVPQVHNFSPID